MPQLSYSFDMSSAKIDEAIPALGNRAKSVKADIHKVAVSVLADWHRSGDASTATRRATDMLEVDKHYSQGLVNWFKQYAGFDYDTSSKSFSYTATKIAVEAVKAAKAETFEQLTPPRDPKPMDFLSELQRVINKAEKHMAESVDGDKVDPDLVAKIKAVITA